MLERLVNNFLTNLVMPKLGPVTSMLHVPCGWARSVKMPKTSRNQKARPMDRQTSSLIDGWKDRLKKSLIGHTACNENASDGQGHLQLHELI